jgi:3-hydroxyacyl-CoA dehydrogenase/enoyl-CoA hydratase/3-hydroxybutyryl-CoA epimerase
MVEEFGRLGKKSGQGFYDYPEGGSRRLWPGLAEFFPVAQVQPAVDAVIERLVAIQSIEAARCLTEGVVKRPMDADIGALLGWGYPAFRGGPIGWIDTMGVAEFVAAAERLAASHGARFAPPPLLKEMAARGERFYPR